ncbi:hypothetical protein QBC46DRAFT_452855, partial [Diplogelasinospora grovesii]
MQSLYGVPEVIVVVFQDCQDFRQVLALASTCKHLYSVWQAHSRSIIWGIALRKIPDFDHTLMTASLITAREPWRMLTPKLAESHEIVLRCSAGHEITSAPASVRDTERRRPQTGPRGAEARAGPAPSVHCKTTNKKDDDFADRYHSSCLADRYHSSCLADRYHSSCLADRYHSSCHGTGVGHPTARCVFYCRDPPFHVQPTSRTTPRQVGAPYGKSFPLTTQYCSTNRVGNNLEPCLFEYRLLSARPELTNGRSSA